MKWYSAREMNQSGLSMSKVFLLRTLYDVKGDNPQKIIMTTFKIDRLGEEFIGRWEILDAKKPFLAAETLVQRVIRVDSSENSHWIGLINSRTAYNFLDSTLHLNNSVYPYIQMSDYLQPHPKAINKKLSFGVMSSIAVSTNTWESSKITTEYLTEIIGQTAERLPRRERTMRPDTTTKAPTVQTKRIIPSEKNPSAESKIRNLSVAKTSLESDHSPIAYNMDIPESLRRNPLEIRSGNSSHSPLEPLQPIVQEPESSIKPSAFRPLVNAIVGANYVHSRSFFTIGDESKTFPSSNPLITDVLKEYSQHSSFFLGPDSPFAPGKTDALTGVLFDRSGEFISTGKITSTRKVITYEDRLAILVVHN